jgi:ketosteroid isomerase-like protein
MVRVHSIHSSAFNRSIWIAFTLFMSIFSASVAANIKDDDSQFDYEGFTRDYFSAWKATQAPNATKADLAYYLSFLTDDIGYQHLPYSDNDVRAADGKTQMRKGMSYYLGTHTEYEAILTKSSYGHNVITLEYDTQTKGVHPDNGQIISNSYTSLEVLEIDNGKVSVIRHYSD